MCYEKLSRDEMDTERWNVLGWKIIKAPSQSEILWDNLNKGGIKSKLKSIVLLILLMVVCIILVTPLFLVQKLSPLIEAWYQSVEGITFF
jgi:hypothetical protein